MNLQFLLANIYYHTYERGCEPRDKMSLSRKKQTNTVNFMKNDAY